MKKKLYIFLIGLLTIGFTQAQSVDNIKKSLTIGSAKELVKNFDKLVEIRLDNKTFSHSKAQAEVLLKDFFQQRPPVSFKYIHKGESNQGKLKYAIGMYQSTSSKFRVLIRYKTVDGKDLIYNISFTRE